MSTAAAAIVVFRARMEYDKFARAKCVTLPVDEDDKDDEEGMDEDDEDDEEGVDEEDEAEFYLGESALMAEQTAILESIQDEAYVESNRRFLREEQAKTDELDVEQEAEANDIDVRMEIVDISDDGE